MSKQRWKTSVEILKVEMIEFDFPRSTKPEHLCLTDYFGNNDVVAFQSVTVGNKVADILNNGIRRQVY